MAILIGVEGIILAVLGIQKKIVLPSNSHPANAGERIILNSREIDPLAPGPCEEHACFIKEISRLVKNESRTRKHGHLLDTWVDS